MVLGLFSKYYGPLQKPHNNFTPRPSPLQKAGSECVEQRIICVPSKFALQCLFPSRPSRLIRLTSWQSSVENGAHDDEELPSPVASHKAVPAVEEGYQS